MNKELTAKWIIGLLTIVVSALVVFMYINPGFQDIFDAHFPKFDKSVFPLFHAVLNSFVAIFLVLALVFIKRKKIFLHKLFTIKATIFSTIFLLSYVFYHNISSPTPYGGQGIWKSIYYVILISHICLAAFSFPFILFTLYQSIVGNYAKHRKIAKVTWPIWFYVAVSGVLVYVFIYPYYV